MDKQNIEKEFIEKGADLEHNRWAKWQKYMHSKMLIQKASRGDIIYFPNDLWEHWERQSITKYRDLSEKEKESDREQVKVYLPLLREVITQTRQQERERIIKIISLNGEFSIKDGREKFASEFKKEIINKIKELK